MKKEQLKDLKNALERKRDELSDLLEKRDLITVERVPDAIDQVQLTVERELAIEMLHRKTLVLRQVRDSLRRLAEGTFGICRRCEREIGLKRLQAVPWAVYCVDCQAVIDEEERAQSLAGPVNGIPSPVE
jgi:DnaK suppressor protein